MAIGNHAYIRKLQTRLCRAPCRRVMDEAQQIVPPGVLRKIAVVEDKGPAVAFHVSLCMQLDQNGVILKIHGLERLEKRPNVETAILAQDKLSGRKVAPHHLGNSLCLVNIRHHEV